MQKAIILTEDLSKVFNLGKINEVSAVENISLEIENNTCNILKGSSGSGKTTLLTLLGCLARPTSGRYYCLGENISLWSEKFLTSFRQKNIGIVFQNFQLIRGMSVFWNIAMPLLPQNFTQKQISKKVKEVAAQVDILHRLNFNSEELSGGEMQRVAIARALINSPKIILADEPTAHLDRENSENILQIFEQLKNEGKTLMITTHDIIVEQSSLVDRIIIMQDGKLLED